MAKAKKSEAPWVIRANRTAHAGHRKRMRARVCAPVSIRVEEHELIEVMLFYAIPRKNVNNTAHLLLSRFGSICGMLDASEEELMTVPGIGRATAQYLRKFSALLNELHDLQMFPGAPPVLDQTQDVTDLLLDRGEDMDLPQILLILMNSSQVFLKLCAFPGHKLPELRQILQECRSVSAAKVILVECGRTASAGSIPGNIREIRALVSAVQSHGIHVWDYLLTDPEEDDLRSLRRRGMLI